MDVDNSLADEFRNLNKNDAEFEKRCATIVYDIQQGNSTLLNVVEQLKTLLIDNAPEHREQGMLILSEVLRLLPNDFLTSVQLNFICAFYTDRLNDHHQVVPTVLKGILTLLKYENLPEGVTKQLLTSLFQNVPCQQQQQSDRSNIYKILELTLERRYAELTEMGYDYVYGVISAMDGERDPRNLLYLFNWLPKFLKKTNLGHLKEEMFEVMACYFPVDFKAPPQDPNTISRDELADALCVCLCALPEFAEYCMPLALEKLSSNLLVAKLDSLKILIEGCRTFEVATYIQHSTDIWSQIQREIFNTIDENLEKHALICLETVINKLSKTSSDILNRVLSDIIDTLKGNLLPNMKLFEPSYKMLCYIARASNHSANRVTRDVIPILVNTYNITLTPGHKAVLLKSLVNFVRIYTEVHQNVDITNVEELSTIPNLCLKAALSNEEDFKTAALSSLTIITKYLPYETRNCLYENLCVWLVTEQPKSYRDSLLKCLRSVAREYPAEMKINFLDKISINENNGLSLYLDALTVMVDQDEFTETILQIFVNYILSDIQSAEIATGALANLLNVYEGHEKIYNLLMTKEKIIFKIIEWVLQNIDDICIKRQRVLLQNINSIFKLLMIAQTTDTQNEIVDLKLNKIVEDYKNNHNYVLLIMLSGILITLKNDVRQKYDIVDNLIDVSLNATDIYVQEVSLKLLSSIINKNIIEDFLHTDLRKIKEACYSVLDNCEDIQPKIKAIDVLIWITKALIIRGHTESKSWIDNLLNLLENYNEVAIGLKIIMNKNEDCLNIKNNCNTKPLYRQKFFIEVSEKLAENFIETNENYLTAIGYLLQETPKQIIILQFKKILRPIILCLEHCNNPEALIPILEMLCELIQNQESVAEDHIQEFLPRLLKLSKFDCSMKVRIKALHCLQRYTFGFPLYKLLPHKQNVIHSLIPCLDDKKRLVRKEAVQARLLWFMIDAPQ